MSRSDGHLGIGDRLAEGPAPELVRSAFALEAADGALLHHGMSLADLAHAMEIIRCGIMPAAQEASLLSALLEMYFAPADDSRFDPRHGDPYSNREVWLRKMAPEAAGWLQAGRARREVSTVGYTLVVRGKMLDVIGAQLALMRAVLDVAAAHVTTWMPDFTYLQHAHPTSLAHYLLGFVQPMTRDLARLRSAFSHVNRSPAGSGSTNGSRFPLDRRRLAASLGFDELVVHTRDAMWQADTPIEVVATALALLVNVDRLAEDLQLWATAEFGFVEVADRHARISVIMPQKKNPYSLTFVRGVARDMIGCVASTAALQSTPSGQVDNRIFTYGGVPRALMRTAQALDLLAATISGLRFDTDAMARAATEREAGATDLAEFITIHCGIDVRTAHRIVGRAIRLSREASSELQASILNEAAQAVVGRSLDLSDGQIAAVVRPDAIVETRTCPGGASRASVEAMIGEFRRVAADHEEWLTSCRARIQSAERALVAEAQARSQTS